ncbi:uncharacterized protein LOC117582024 [Drosophila guanche]|uniref:Uncharacterized protein n=1 Tax=Drosophila guanche TaxID=7266 RepID=A0A3B0JAL4_DROGU|nr:uncharacterized protein LOC117582024 [Drosophila guanche]SPP79354.1 Hypothetical predicted protein [Drosophila guanche]
MDSRGEGSTDAPPQYAELSKYHVPSTSRTPVPTPEWQRIPTVDFDTFDGLSNLNKPLDYLSLQERHRTKLTNRKKVLAYQHSHHQRLAELWAAQQAAKCDTSGA